MPEELEAVELAKVVCMYVQCKILVDNLPGPVRQRSKLRVLVLPGSAHQLEWHTREREREEKSLKLKLN